MKKLYFFSIVLLFSLGACMNQSEHPLISGELTQLATDFKFTEGPIADDQGNIYFTDIPNLRIHIWTVKGELKIFRENSGAANGLYFDKRGNLMACEGGNRRVTSISKTNNTKVLSETFQGRKYNKPNDLWIAPNGGIYFSDPAYGVDTAMLEMDVEGVYYIHPNKTEVSRVCDDLIRPNGIIGNSDGKTLYVTDHFGEMTWEYKIQEDGMLSNKKPFAEIGGDGMTMDSNKNVYLTNIANKSVDILSPEGEQLVSMPMPESPTNVCFGGPDHSTLFITTGASLYSIKMNIKGQK